MGVFGGEDKERAIEQDGNNKEDNEPPNLPEANASSKDGKARWWVWIILVLALFAMSSAASALRALNAPPLLKASWRLQATSLLLLVGFVYQLYKLLSANETNSTTDYSPDIKKRYFTVKTFGIMGLSGASLAVHFGTWVVSLDYTSLAHSLLFVCSSPILIVFGSLVLRLPISWGEIIGSVLGFLGMVLTILDTFLNPPSGNDTPGVLGDFLAFLGALVIIAYLYVGKNLRSWMALYLYAFPVTLLSAILLLVASLIGEKDALSYGIFEWFSSEYILLVAYLAVGPGFVGHTGVNAILKYIEPVVITVTLLMEPVIGSFIGYMLKQSGIPGLFTFLGGPVIIAGCILVTISANKRSTNATHQSTNKLFIDVRARNLDVTQSTEKLLVTDDVIEGGESKTHQTTKYKKLSDVADVELNVIVRTSTESDNKQ